jgi:Tol biopolymer transport system component
MDHRERYQESQPFQSFAKSFAAGIAILSLLACSHKPSPLPAGLSSALNSPSGPALDVTSLGIQLTRVGENLSPALSADGKKVVFVSRKRPSHSQGQIYIYDLENLKERRVTYQDGDCRDPILLSDGRVVYASTTDELKERPLLLQKKPDPSPYPPTDLYVSEVSGSDIIRLTQHGGFDGFPWQRPDRSESILYSQWSGQNLDVHQLNLISKNSIPLLNKKDVSIESMRLSPDSKQWAWIERTADGKTQILLSPSSLAPSKQKTLSLPKGDYKSLIWASNQKLIFAARALKKYDQLYSLDLSNNCLQSLFDANSDLGSPQLNAEKNALVFTSSSGGSSQIFYKSLPAPSECLKWEETTKN